MSDELVNSLKSEAVDVSSDESKLEQEGSRQRDSDSDERQRDSVGDNDDDEEEEEEEQEEEEQEEEEQEERQDRRTDDNVLNGAEEKPPVTAEPTSTTPSAALEPSTRGRKRDRIGKPVVEPVVSSTAKTEIETIPLKTMGKLGLRTATARERGGRGQSSLGSGTLRAVAVRDKQVPMDTSIRFFNANNERN